MQLKISIQLGARKSYLFFRWEKKDKQISRKFNKRNEIVAAIPPTSQFYIFFR